MYVWIFDVVKNLNCWVAYALHKTTVKIYFFFAKAVWSPQQHLCINLLPNPFGNFGAPWQQFWIFASAILQSIQRYRHWRSAPSTTWLVSFTEVRLMELLMLKSLPSIGLEDDIGRVKFIYYRVSKRMKFKHAEFE